MQTDTQTTCEPSTPDSIGVGSSPLLGSVAWQEITGRRWLIKEGYQMARGYFPEWMPVDASVIGSLASEEYHYNGWRIRRPMPNAGSEPHGQPEKPQS